MKKKEILFNEKNAYFCPHCGRILIPKKVLKKNHKYKYVKCAYCKSIFAIKIPKWFIYFAFIMPWIFNFGFLLPKQIIKSFLMKFHFHIFFLIVLFYLILGLIELIIYGQHVNFEYMDDHEIKKIKNFNKKIYKYIPILYKSKK